MKELCFLESGRGRVRRTCGNMQAPALLETQSDGRSTRLVPHLPRSGAPVPFQVERQVPQFKSNREQLRCFETDSVPFLQQSLENSGSAAGAVHRRSWRDIQVVTQRWDHHFPKSSEDSVGAVSAETGARSSSDTKTGPHVERVRKTVPTRRHSSPTSGGSPSCATASNFPHSADCTRETMVNPQGSLTCP